MSLHILRCGRCNGYGLLEACPCGGARRPVKPPKYSPQDKWGEYRRRAKAQQAPQKA